MKGREHFGERDVDAKIILKSSSQKHCVRLRTEKGHLVEYRYDIVTPVM
jgi:hypothetical protein